MPILYAPLMLAALVVGWWLGRDRSAAIGISRRQRAAVALGAFAGAMLAAKLPFVLGDWRGLLTGAAWFRDGKTILLGLVGGYVGVEIAKWSLGVKTKTGDSFAVPVAAAVSIGRLACLAAGCCYGIPCRWPWGLDFGDGQPRHPTQLYEAAFHAAAACTLAYCQRRGYFRGQLIKLYILAYLVYRFASETLRPEPIYAAGLTYYQWLALALAPIFAALWWADQRRYGSQWAAESAAIAAQGAPR